SPSGETLCRLHRAHVMSIPFENLDLFLGLPLLLDPESLVSKLVERRRGGYCHELNGLFSLLLQHLGFTVTPLGARVFHGGTLMQKSHQLMLVEIEGKRWIADVGFGGNTLIEALPLEVEREFPQHLDTFRLQIDPKLGFVLQHQLGEQWRSLYAFSLEEYYPADYQMMHYYTSTSPASPFTQHVICTLSTDDARVILYDSELKIRRLDGTVTTHFEGGDSYREMLQRSFGIVLPAGSRLHSPSSQFRILL
ncbi:MAG TPA: arylamine N-acetyltransferase, partial [Ktedonobacteraceae bacterium]|nr:arylamine N-acetyltransferase [Ktedonobacteraceae bacterium]